jgi:hypothetical protein
MATVTAAGLHVWEKLKFIRYFQQTELLDSKLLVEGNGTG